MNLPIANEQVSTGEGEKSAREREQTSPREAIKVSNSDPCLQPWERAELLSISLFLPPPHLWVLHSLGHRVRESLWLEKTLESENPRITES